MVKQKWLVMNKLWLFILFGKRDHYFIGDRYMLYKTHKFWFRYVNHEMFINRK